MAHLAYVRHGVSQANVDAIIAGHFDSPLIEKGRYQARATANLIKDISFQHAFGSPLQRAKETLEIILEEIRQGIAPEFHDALKERNWGDAEQTPYGSRVNGKYSFEESEASLTWSGKTEGGESYEDMSNRVIPFFDQNILPKLKVGQNILVVAHNGISKPLQRHLEDIPHEKTYTLDLKNCEVKLYEFDENGSVVNIENRVASI